LVPSEGAIDLTSTYPIYVSLLFVALNFSPLSFPMISSAARFILFRASAVFAKDFEARPERE
jgi:hypothetical protein